MTIFMIRYFDGLNITKKGSLCKPPFFYLLFCQVL